MSDLEPETQSQMFQKELLKLEPKSITTKGTIHQKNSKRIRFEDKWFEDFIEINLCKRRTQLNNVMFSGFACFKSFFENVNIYEHKLKKPGMVSLALSQISAPAVLPSEDTAVRFVFPSKVFSEHDCCCKSSTPLLIQTPTPPHMH